MKKNKVFIYYDELKKRIQNGETFDEIIKDLTLKEQTLILHKPNISIGRFIHEFSESLTKNLNQTGARRQAKTEKH